jgi:UDP:flavonoid glycosyltransferase YjiC (YdhE family)
VVLVAGPDAGHAFPVAALALALQRRGCEPLVLTGNRWIPPLKAAGVAAEVLPNLRANRADVGFGYRLYGRGAEMAPAAAALIEGHGADLVVTDTLTVSGAFAADLVGVPWIELVPHHDMSPSEGLPPSGTGWRPGRGPIGRRRDAAFRRLNATGLVVAERQRTEARRSIGLPDSGPPLARLIATIPALELPRPDRSADAVLVGPLVWDPATTDLAPPTGAGPLALVSESTAGNGVGGLLEAALGALPRLPGLRLVATRLSPYDGVLPAGVVVGAGRQDPLLREASVALTTAGNGIVTKVARCGVPLVLVPGVGDQRENAIRLARAGAAIVVPARLLTPSVVARSLRRVLEDPGYAAAARRVADEAAGLGADYAAAVVEALAHGEPLPTPRRPVDGWEATVRP